MVSSFILFGRKIFRIPAPFFLHNFQYTTDLCEEYGLQPTVFYRWQKAFFENGAQAFAKSGDRQTTKLKGRIAELEEKLAKKNEVLGEVMEEMVALKKRNGAS